MFLYPNFVAAQDSLYWFTLRSPAKLLARTVSNSTLNA